MKNSAARFEFANGEIHDALAQGELKRQPDLAKFRVEVLDPIFESLRRERSHVAEEDDVQELADRLALLLADRMHLHA